VSLERIEELREPPVVGREYLVPCVRYWWKGALRWWPVIGPKHDDIEHLNFAQVHYHLDRRFLRLADFRRFGWTYGRRHLLRGVTNLFPSDTALAATPLSEFGFGTAYNPNNHGPADEGGPLPASVHRRRRCLVADVGFPTIERAGEKFERFHAAYEGKRCSRDSEGRLICPHKGALLDSLAPDRHGRAICPLHGLAIDMRSGVVVKRPRGGRAA
jgi:hypothetical protein